jgi:opacity protein-like surface antigen
VLGAAVLIAGLALPIRAASQVTLGLSGGLSIASLTGDDVDEDLGSRTGMNVGGFLELPLADIVWLVPGVYYVQKGASSDNPDGKIKIDYVEVPLLLRVGVSQRSPVGVNLFLGPTFAFQAKCEFEFGSITGSCESQAASDFDATKKFDLGLAVGAGLSFAVSPNVSFLTNAMWDLGLMSIDDSAAENDVKNEAIWLNVGLAFRPGM